ncbi:hypothetical protein PAMC26577_13025 [Caballeronia sordidicola]|uniref:Uncharacterized protein n=1 Tax=Caballeronia sordidicola TaxID=196367 RepID=A0A242MW27_CABSO|nr:hypothetical protein PAMC26577_13025 [Caballeronia sordidicola]
MIDHYNAAPVTKLEQEVFEQRARLAWRGAHTSNHSDQSGHRQ